jgi:hypothetical protein
MLSRISMKWRWYDWIFLGFAVLAICGVIAAVAPTSGLAIGLHKAFHGLAIGLEWVAGGLTALAGLLNSL